MTQRRLPVFPAKAGIRWAGGPGLKQIHLVTVLDWDAIVSVAG